MATDRSREDGDGSLTDTVLVSNRGPLAFHMENGVPVAGSPGGGLAGSLHPLVVGTGAKWVASALDDADRAAAAAGLMAEDGLDIELVDPDPDIYNMAYNVVSNATLWFCHHHLFDAARRPRSDGRWAEAWDAYREFNELFAHKVAKVAPEGGRILVQDYHLALMGSALGRLRPDLRTVHFTHTPFADPSVLRMLPTAVGTELLSSMAAFGACGFHTERWAAAYRQGRDAFVPEGDASARSNRDFVSALSVDPRPSGEVGRRSPGGPGKGPPRGADWRVRSPGHRAGGPDGAVEESASGVLGLRRAPRAPAPASPAGGVRGPGLPHPAEPARVPRLPQRGRVDGGAHQRQVGYARLDTHRAGGGRRLPSLTRRPHPLRRPVGQSGAGRSQPGGEGGAAAQHPARRAGAVARGRGLRGAWAAALEINPFDVSGTAAVLARALDMDDDQKGRGPTHLR
jgi:hypothetical protein